MKYYYKATLDNGVSGFGKDFKYKLGINTHPNPDMSDIVCGEGLHLARTLADANNYVSEAKEFYLAIPDKILGKDSAKIRTNQVNLLFKIPQGIIREYRAKLNSLYDEHWTKGTFMGDEYGAKRKQFDKDIKIKILRLYRKGIK